MARLCLACQSTVSNRAEHCLTCGRNLTETERVWEQGFNAWRGYLEDTGWYPDRRDEWVEQRLQSVVTYSNTESTPPRRLVSRYLSGHPELPRPSRVVLTRSDDAVIITAPGWWPARSIRVAIPLATVRKVSLERMTENTPDDAVLSAAIGGARTGPFGLAFGSAVGRRRRVVRTVHVHSGAGSAVTELVFRSLDDHNSDSGATTLMRMFQRK